MKIRNRLASSVAAAILSLIAETAPAGTPIAVNSGQEGWCTSPAIASVGPTRVVAVWACDSPSGDNTMGNFGRLLAFTGRPIGPIFRIGRKSTPNPYTPPQAPDVTSLPDGGFAVVWREKFGDEPWTTKVQRFDATALPSEDPVPVPTNPIWPGWTIKTAAGETGDVFIAAYQRFSSDIQVHRFEYTNDIQQTFFTIDVGRVDELFSLADIEVGPGNRPVIVWNRAEPGTRGAHNEINAASFETDGTPIDRFSLENDNYYCSPRKPRAASGPDGVTLAWEFNGLCGPEDEELWSLDFDRLGLLASHDPVSLSNEVGWRDYDIVLRADGSPVLVWSVLEWIRGSGPTGFSGPITIAEGVDADDPRLAGNDRFGFVVVWEEDEGWRSTIFAAPFAVRASRSGGLRVDQHP